METIVSLGLEHHILASCNVSTCMVILCILCLNTFIYVLEHYMLLLDQASSCVLYHINIIYRPFLILYTISLISTVCLGTGVTKAKKVTRCEIYLQAVL